MNRDTGLTSALPRRRFSAAALSTVSMSLISSRARAFDTADVIVIGAGLAGLNAALTLEGQGYSVIVIEAADYVGGRTKTYDLAIGPTNAGGQVIDPYYARVRDLVARLNVPLTPVPGIVPMGLYINGSLLSAKDWANSAANKTVGIERSILPEGLEFYYLSNGNPLPDPESWTDPAQAKFDVPINEYLKSKGASDEALKLISVTLNAFDFASCSALAYLRDIKRLQWSIANSDNKSRATYGASDADGFKYNEVAGGTQRLPEAMARALKSEVRLNQTVASIEMTSSGVEVGTVDGGRYKGKYCVSAIPFSSLRNVDVSPNFSGAQLDAVRESGHSNTIRAFLEFTSPFWENDIGEPGLFTDSSIERVFGRKNAAGEIFALEAWINGNAASRLDQLPADAAGALVVDTLARIRPASKGKVRLVKMHSWVKDSPSSCCRHVYGPGQVAKWAGLVAKPHGRLHLAGEQTRSIENGMEAAAESGERAALEILNRDG